ncbi:Zinc finger and Nuclear hormone receptor domain containing protein [Aphelenchoides bicaudatus]|nr:Zinc finger and Nuclear hormone receptor domain containing protein [Aphelenchoides bicaudatus]
MVNFRLTCKQLRLKFSNKFHRLQVIRQDLLGLHRPNLTVSTLNEEQKPKGSRKRKQQAEESSIERKLTKEISSQFIRDRIVSAASLTEEMLKREKLEQALREQLGNREEDTESSVGGLQKQQAKCVVCGDAAFGKHYGVASCNGCKSYFRRSVWFNRQYICRYEGSCVIEKGCRNACRACRLKACFLSGMNPRAVQSERERFNGHPKNQSTESVETACQTEPIFGDSLKMSNAYLWQQQMLDDELTKKGQELLTTHIQTFNLIDDQLNRRFTNQFHEIPFVNAFFDPQQVAVRTPIRPQPLRKAVADDLIQDYLRCFVLFSDWLTSWKEFKSFKYNDQIVFAQNRFSLFHYLFVSIWSAEANINGICYSNGTYFERGGDSVSQSGPQLELQHSLMEKLLDGVVKDICQLNMTETEKICLFAVAFFSDVENIGLSDEAVEMAGNLRDLYVRVLYNHIVHMNAQLPNEQTNAIQILMRKQSDASLRSSKILLLISSLKTIVTLSPNEGKLGQSIIGRVFTSFSTISI